MLWCWSRVSRALQTLKFHCSARPAETLYKVSPSELLQWCHWWLQRNTAVSPVKLLKLCLNRVDWQSAVLMWGVKPWNDLWPSSFLLPQPKTTPFPLVIWKLSFNSCCEIYDFLVWVWFFFWSLFHVCFPADYYRLRVGGLILAAVLCLIGIMILLSKMEKACPRAQICSPFCRPAHKKKFFFSLSSQVADAGASSTRTRGNISCIWI